MTDNVTINQLIEGYKNFRAKYFEQSELYNNLVKYGQNPKALVIACCDSRVDPAIVTGCEPGELFVVRNVANLVPPFDNNPQYHGTSAAIEFAVKSLKVQNIIVFGHSFCGGIRALMETKDNENQTDFINAWMGIAKLAKEKVLKEYQHCSLDEKAHHCEQESLITSLNNLHTFPWIAKRVEEKQLFTHAWYFNLTTGLVEAYDPKTEKFIVIANEAGEG